MAEHKPSSQAVSLRPQFFLLRAFPWFALLLSAGPLYADRADSRVIEIRLGDYRYMPEHIQLVSEQPVILRLTNVDSFTPHNFTLEDGSDGLDVNVDIPAGESVEVFLMPMVTGSHTFYCRNQLLFFDSHRKKGMEGVLTVVPSNQAGLPPSQSAEQQAR